MALRIEFTVEPFHDGAPGPHVRAAVEAVRAAGLAVDFGPFGSSVEGDDDQVLAAADAVSRAAIGAGATRVSMQIARPG
ncbi:MAG TPA: thiamine-binding protein [Acidimicrobiia bacterium]|jgi:uncharacterized protein YqgV (UPF0045/DUF77 family)|nr:thiamine-binding protein [Acidimicrobiia bacterium]